MVRGRRERGEKIEGRGHWWCGIIFGSCLREGKASPSPPFIFLFSSIPLPSLLPSPHLPLFICFPSFTFPILFFRFVLVYVLLFPLFFPPSPPPPPPPPSSPLFPLTQFPLIPFFSLFLSLFLLFIYLSPLTPFITFPFLSPLFSPFHTFPLVFLLTSTPLSPLNLFPFH